MAIAFAVIGCRGPTQVTVEVTTDVGCDMLDLTTVVLGQRATLERVGGAETATDRCADGEPRQRVGSIVLLPGEEDDEPFALRVVGVVGVDPALCTPAFDYGVEPGAPPDAASPTTGCIVARRSLSFLPHRPLMLPITLSKSCIGTPCAPDETCVDHTCRPSGVDPEDCADAQGCGEEELAASAASSGAGASGSGGAGASGSGGAGAGAPGGGGSGGAAGGTGARGGHRGGAPCTPAKPGAPFYDCCTDADCTERGSTCELVAGTGHHACKNPPSGPPCDNMQVCCPRNDATCPTGTCVFGEQPDGECPSGPIEPEQYACLEPSCDIVNNTCATGALCVAGGQLGFKVNGCLPMFCGPGGACPGGGTCAPVVAPCCTPPEMLGMFCVDPAKGNCRDSSDCSADQHCDVPGDAAVCLPGPQDSSCPL
ncbi:MAG: hypothetical protein WKG00_26715 [Polyangiaceae bacterium]